MVMSRYGNTQVQRRTDGGGRGCKPKGAYKKVLRPSRRLGLVTTKSSLILLEEKRSNYVAIYPASTPLLRNTVAVKDTK